MAKQCDFCKKKLGFWGDGRFDLKDGTICRTCLAKNSFFDGANQRKIAIFLKTQTIVEVQDLIDNQEKLEKIKLEVAPEKHLIGNRGECSFCHRKIGVLDTKHPLKDGVLCEYCLVAKTIFDGVNHNKMDEFLKDKTVAEVQDLIDNPQKLSPVKEEMMAIEKARIEAEKKLQAEMDEFKKNSIKYSHYYISSKQRRILIGKTLLTNPRFVEADEIVSYKVNVKGHDEHKHHTIARATAGGLIAGQAGAVLAGVTGGKDTEFIDHIGLIITLINGSNFEIKFLRTKTKANSWIVKDAYSELQNLISIIDAWQAQKTRAINQYSKDEQVTTEVRADSQIDIPTEIRKYKSLADDGIITSEDFEAKKRQLLDM